ncbi:MAG: LysE family translocator [Pseudomonadota bacterium]
MSLENIVAIAVAFFIVTVSPGPANIAVATVSMRAGRRDGLLFGLGLSVGLAFWGLVAATGLGTVLQNAPPALFALKVFGGCYLLWLAWQSAKSVVQAPETTDQELGKERSQKPGNERWFWRGLILNMSNPKAVVAWLAALSMGLDGGGSGVLVVVATLVCIALGFANYAGYALAFSLSGFMASYRRLAKWIDGVVAGLFAVAGLSLLRSAFAR